MELFLSVHVINNRFLSVYFSLSNRNRKLDYYEKTINVSNIMEKNKNKIEMKGKWNFLRFNINIHQLRVTFSYFIE